MNDEMIFYECKVCNTIFAIDKVSLRRAEIHRKYLACPLDGRHNKRDIKKCVDYESMMKHNKGVHL